MGCLSGTLLFNSLLFWLITFNGTEVLRPLLPLPENCCYFCLSPNTPGTTGQEVVVWCAADWSGGSYGNKIFSAWNSLSSTSQAGARPCPRQKPHLLGSAQWQGVLRDLCQGQRRGPGAGGSCGDRRHEPQVVLSELDAASK